MEEEKLKNGPCREINLVSEITSIVNSYGIDTEANMPDFIIARYMIDSINILMKANEANSAYFKLSAQEEELKN